MSEQEARYTLTPEGLAEAAAFTAEELIVAEIERQIRMWGPVTLREDADNGELMWAGIAQLDALFDRQNGEPDAFDGPPEIYPEGWSGFRDYGSDVANLVVGVSFLIQEIIRKIAAGEDTTRKSRDPVQQPYGFDKPAVMEL